MKLVSLKLNTVSNNIKFQAFNNQNSLVSVDYFKYIIYSLKHKQNNIN